MHQNSLYYSEFWEGQPEGKTIWKTCYQQTEAVNHATALYITKMAKKMDTDLRPSILSVHMRKKKMLYR